jgi:hypothetical protein
MSIISASFSCSTPSSINSTSAVPMTKGSTSAP